MQIATDTRVEYVRIPLGICALHFAHQKLTKVTLESPRSTTQSTTQAAQELQEYGEGARREFSIPVEVAGTPFQQKVWQETSRIPYGETRTYAQIAQAIGHPKAVRAVGTALGANPVPIVIPCHRVVPTSGGIGKYALGTAVKQALLNLEQHS